MIPLTPSGKARCWDPGTAHIMSWSANWTDGRRTKGEPYPCPVCVGLLERRAAETVAESYEDLARQYSQRGRVLAHFLATGGAPE